MASDKTKKDGWNPKPTPSPFRKILPPPHVPTDPPPSLSERRVDEAWDDLAADDLPDTLPGAAIVEAEGSSNTEVPAPARKIVTRPSSPRAIRLDDLKKAMEDLKDRHDEVFPPYSDPAPPAKE
jgi:hypothetical protein